MREDVRQTLIFLGSTHFLIHVYSQLLQATLPIIRQQHGLTLTEASLLVSIPMFVQVFLYLPAGHFADRRTGLVLSLGFIVTAIGALMAPNAQNYIHLLVSFSLISLGSTLYHPPALKMTSEIPGEKKGLAMGIQNAGGSLGYSAGPLVYGLLFPLYGWRMGYYLWVPLIIVATLYSYRFVSHIHAAEGSASKGSYRDMASKRFTLVVMGGALTDATFVIISIYITTYFTENWGVSPGLAGIIFGVGPLLGIFGSILGGYLGDRVGRRSGFLVVLLGLGITLGLIPLTGGLLLSSISYVIWRGLYSASMPLMNSLIAENTAKENRSLGYSVYSIASNLIGAAIPPLVTGTLLETSLRYMFPVSVGLLIPVAVMMLSLRDVVPLDTK